MKGKRVITGILLVGILAVTLAGVQKIQMRIKKKRENPSSHSEATTIHHTII